MQAATEIAPTFGVSFGSRRMPARPPLKDIRPKNPPLQSRLTAAQRALVGKPPLLKPAVAAAGLGAPPPPQMQKGPARSLQATVGRLLALCAKQQVASTQPPLPIALRPLKMAVIKPVV